MKRLVGVFVAVIVLYAIYHDLSRGTLPAVTTEQTTITKENPTAQLPYFEKKVVVGDTVLSVLEDRQNHSISLPISKVVSDFRQLNNEISPQEIQPGKVYKFPDYQNE